MSIRVIIRNDKTDKKGEAPLYIRMYRNGRHKLVSLDLKIKPEYWDKEKERVKSGHPNKVKFNSILNEKRVQFDTLYLDIVGKNEGFNKGKIDLLKGKRREDFFSYSKRFISKTKVNRSYGYHRRVFYTIEKVKEFYNRTELPFNEITVTFLRKYERYLMVDLKNKRNTVHSNFKVLRAIYNSAVNEELIDDVINPFNQHKIKLEKTEREYLTMDEVEKIKSLELEDDLNDHRNMFIFSCISGGLRISDILTLKWSHIDSGVIRKKTRKSGSGVTIGIPNSMIDLLKKYGLDNTKKGFVFPVLPEDYDKFSIEAQHRVITTSTAYINQNLKTIGTKAGLDKNLSFHISRHTFATLALKRKMRVELLKEIMGHTNIKETMIYAKIAGEDVIDAMKAFNEI